MYQKIIIAGRLGRDPEMRYTPSGQAVTNFSVAVDGWDGQQKTTAWFRVSAWGKQAETCNQFLKKGSSCIVDGRLNFDAKTGGPKIWNGQSGAGASFEISASDVRFIGSRQDGQQGQQASEGESVGQADQGEQLPF